MNSITISRKGKVDFIWSDDLSELLQIGDHEVRRASHVEPDHNGQWSANMGPSNGPILGPFPLRRDALLAEARWLEDHWQELVKESEHGGA
tara:strand:+ start:57 stop:329 length:273 start_codon:yes stop_codon:yes gene_type:complete